MSQVIAIDGPAGSGKSTTAKAVAERLGVLHVESGALYRALTLAALDSGYEESGQRLVALARSLPIRLDLAPGGVRPAVAGVDVTAAVREARVTERVSAIAAIPEVRAWANDEVRKTVALHPQRAAVLDGRDIGTVVFPDAAVKIYLTARPEVRARRRLIQDGTDPDDEAVARAVVELTARDTADANRPVAPLKAAPDAITIDTSDMTFDEQVERIAAEARKAFSLLDIGK